MPRNETKKHRWRRWQEENMNRNVIVRFSCLTIEAEDQLLCLNVLKEATTIWESESQRGDSEYGI